MAEQASQNSSKSQLRAFIRVHKVPFLIRAIDSFELSPIISKFLDKKGFGILLKVILYSCGLYHISVSFHDPNSHCGIKTTA